VFVSVGQWLMFMSKNSNGRDSIITEWSAKADADLVAAICLLRICPHDVPDVVCYLSEQCIEKYLKAYLSVPHCGAQARFKPTHDLIKLVHLASEIDWTFIDFQSELENFDRYGVEIRYPGEDTSNDEAVMAIRIAVWFRQRLRNLLGLKGQHYVSALWHGVMARQHRILKD
jgi:HEPN domain-containing protein